jgi:hypothetical protein
MAKTHTRKIGLEMDARLYQELSKLATENGQSQGTVRPEVMSHFRRSTDKNRKLHQLLAK